MMMIRMIMRRAIMMIRMRRNIRMMMIRMRLMCSRGWLPWAGVSAP